MQVFQTAGEPPNKGNMSLPNRGCKINISVALTNSVPANSIIKERLRSELEGELDIMIFEVDILCVSEDDGLKPRPTIYRSHALRGNAVVDAVHHFHYVNNQHRMC